MTIGQSPNTSYALIGNIYNALFPKEGAKTVPVPLNFGLQQSFNVDLTILQARHFMSVFQAVYIDNSLQSAPVSVTINQSNQKITCPGNSQGTFPIFVPGNAIFTCVSTGGGQCNLFFTNVPLPMSVWPATQSPQYTANGYLETSDVALDACISSNNLNMITNVTDNNNNVKPLFKADELFTGSATTSAAQTVMTGAPGFFFTDIQVALSGDAALAAAAEYTVTVKDGATTIMQSIVNLPSASGTTPQVISLLNMTNLNYNSKTTSQALTLTASANLSAGKLFWNIAGGLCTSIGP